MGVPHRRKGSPGCQAPGSTGLAGTSEQEQDKQRPPCGWHSTSLGAVCSRTVLILLYLPSVRPLLLVSGPCACVCGLFCLGSPFLFWV